MPREGKRGKRQQLIRRIDRTFSLYVRQYAADAHGMVHCFTCDRPPQHWRQMDCGHFQSRQFMAGRWLLDNAACQCRRCNQRSGEQYRFARQLDMLRGDGFALVIERKARQPLALPLQRLRQLEKYWRDELRALHRQRQNN